MQDLKTGTVLIDNATKDGGTWSLVHMRYTGISCALISFPFMKKMLKPCSFFFMFEPLFQIMLINKIQCKGKVGNSSL